MVLLLFGSVFFFLPEEEQHPKDTLTARVV